MPAPYRSLLEVQQSFVAEDEECAFRIRHARVSPGGRRPTTRGERVPSARPDDTARNATSHVLVVSTANATMVLAALVAAFATQASGETSAMERAQVLQATSVPVMAHVQRQMDYVLARQAKLQVSGLGTTAPCVSQATVVWDAT